MGRHGDHRRLLLMGELVNQFAGADTVHFRHLNIHQNQILLRFSGSFDGLLTAVAEDDMLD